MKLRLRPQLAPIATANAQIYGDCKGEEVNSGSINFSRKVFNIAWVNYKNPGVPLWSSGNVLNVWLELLGADGDTSKNGK